jgi:hypothetical protein
MKIFFGLVFITSMFIFTGCNKSDAEIASKNLSYKADNFEINRRIVFYNGITNQYMLEIIGRCSMENMSNRLAVTCKVGDNEFKKHYLGLSDNISYFSEQLDAVDVSVYHYSVVFKPQSILPDVDFKGSSKKLIESVLPDTKD